MTILVLVACVMLACLPLAIPLFEGVFGLLLTVPLGWFLLGKVLPFKEVEVVSGVWCTLTYLAVFSVEIAALYAVFGQRRTRRTMEEFGTFIAFTAIFLLTYHYATSWPDFIAMGERLRDYSILASTISSPIEPIEPWMDGSVLNYYVYWYRFGHFLASILRLDVWDVYHLMTAFAVSFFAAAVFEVVRKVCGLSIFISGVTAVIATLGSNWAGFLFAFYKDKDASWWGPSRVVKGAINEFPAWSFLLGDLHPHFLNLGLLPLLLLVVFGLVKARETKPLAYLGVGIVVVAGVLWMFAANAWEVPLWLGVLTCIAVASALLHAPYLKRQSKRFITLHGVSPSVTAIATVITVGTFVLAALILGRSFSPILLVSIISISIAIFLVFFPFTKQVGAALRAYYSIRDAKLIVVALGGVCLFAALKLSGSHIVPEGGVVRRVVAPIPLTQTSELFLHWGFPLVCITIGSILLIPRATEKLVTTCMLVGTLLIDDAAPFLVTLIGIQFVRLMQIVKKPTERSTENAFGEGLLLASVCFLLIPEVFFLDDAYGGENERMNTIFKVYVTAWGIITIAAASILTRGFLVFTNISYFSSVVQSAVRITGGALGVIVMGASTLFFFYTTSLRLPSPSIAVVEPASEGLSEIDQRFPGSVTVIRKLREEQGTVLEAQGNAYDYTTFVSTLAGKQAYLGWANHVQLLTKRFLIPIKSDGVYSEVTRRERITEQMYSETPCGQKLEVARNERIRFVVLGTRERDKYPKAGSADYSCFESLISDRQYSLFRVPG